MCKEKPVKKDRFRWNLSIFHWCVDTNQRGYKSVRIHKATPIHARMYLAEKAKKNFKKKFLKKSFKKKKFQKTPPIIFSLVCRYKSTRIQISARTQSYAHTRMYIVQIIYFAEKFLVHFSPPEPAACCP